MDIGKGMGTWIGDMYIIPILSPYVIKKVGYYPYPYLVNARIFF